MVPNESGDAAASRTSARFVRAILLTACVGLAACASDPPGAPAGPPALLERVSGDGQSAAPGAALARPLIARLIDADGHPVRRAEVRWEASAGAVTPPVSTTDANGEAKAVWQLRFSAPHSAGWCDPQENQRDALAWPGRNGVTRLW